MKYLPEFNPSLHSKLLIVTWLMVVYMLLLLLGVASFIAVTYMKSGLAEMNKAALGNSQAALNLKTLVLKTINTVDSYVIGGADRAQYDFDALNNEINTSYAGIYSAADSQEKRIAQDSGFEEWQQVRGLCTTILSSEKSPGGTVARETAQQYVELNDHALRLENALDSLYQMSLSDSDNINRSVKELDERILPVILLLFIMSLGINTVALVFIIRSVVIPTHLLAQAAHNYAKGSLSYRIPLDANNELGELARTFNYMAEKLESSYTALNDKAIHDGLTGMLNHQEFQKRLLWEIKRAARYRRTLSLVMMDIDRFKTLNDTYGHQAGDSVLRAVGQYLRDAIRSSDDAARYGGEEFTLIMPETPAETAFITAQRIGAEIAKMPIAIDEGGTVNITMSIGVATFPQDASSKEELIAAADGMMYRAKSLGRNCVCKPTG